MNTHVNSKEAQNLLGCTAVFLIECWPAVFLTECRPTFQRCMLPPSSGRWVITLMMEAARTSETSVNIQLRTWQYNPEDSELHTRCRENLKSRKLQRNSAWRCGQLGNYQFLKDDSVPLEWVTIITSPSTKTKMSLSWRTLTNQQTKSVNKIYSFCQKTSIYFFSPYIHVQWRLSAHGPNTK
jgi:hypothetical protein